MPMKKKQRFGLIVFIILLILFVLITYEPWNKGRRGMETSMAPDAVPPVIQLNWPSIRAAFPNTGNEDTLCNYLGFDLAYNEAYEQAAWVCYVLSREEIERGNVERSDDFRPDPNISTGSATLDDYRKSGFDRGHIAPAADMKWSEQAMSESFYMTNMSPQLGSFNRGVWKRLETQVREWALEKDSLLVISGPVLEEIDSLIGPNEVGVPPCYFKVLADLSPPDHSFIAFLLPHKASQASLFSFAVSVDSLEAFTGYDFFASAPDQEVIRWLEQDLDTTLWAY